LLPFVSDSATNPAIQDPVKAGILIGLKGCAPYKAVPYGALDEYRRVIVVPVRVKKALRIRGGSLKSPIPSV
jgi:hypothetical protein